jgi:hypothetical protein
MSRFRDDHDRYDIRLDEEDLDEAYEDDEDDGDEVYEDPRVPVLDDVVTPGPGIVPRDAEPETPLDRAQAERLHALIREAVDLALDDALDMLRGELHARLRDHLDERLPELVAEALRERDSD